MPTRHLLIVTRVFMPDSPVRAKFLKQDDKQVAIERCVATGPLQDMFLNIIGFE